MKSLTSRGKKQPREPANRSRKERVLTGYLFGNPPERLRSKLA
jgi:hypothetical protein